MQRRLARAWSLAVAACLSACWTAVAAVSEEIRFTTLSLEDGLSQASALAILQDRRGFMWIGGQDGLNRYDGYNIEVLKHDPADASSLSDNFIQGLFEDLDGKIWVLTFKAGVINRFDPRSGRFERFTHDPRGAASVAAARANPRAFWEDPRSVWIGTNGGGLNKIDKASGTVTRLTAGAAGEGRLADDRVTAIVADAAGTLWVGTRGGLHRRQPGEGDRFERFRHDPVAATSLTSDFVTALHVDRGGRLWVGTWGGGLCRFVGDSQGFECHRHDPRDPRSLASDVVVATDNAGRTLAEDEEGNLWMATLAGVSRLAVATGVVSNYLGQPGATSELPDSTVNVLHVDRMGELWVGSNHGLYHYDAGNDRFMAHRRDPWDDTTLASNAIVSIYEGRSGILWFGTSNGGVSRYSRVGDKFQHLRSHPSRADGLADSKVFSILEDGAGTLWVGTMEGGLHRFDRQRRRVVERYAHHPGSQRDLRSNFVRALLEDRQGNLWVGTIGGGVAWIDRDRGEVSARFTYERDNPRSLSGNSSTSIYEDRHGEVWIATERGWNRFAPETRDFTRYLERQFVRFTEEDQHGDLWLGSIDGLRRFDRVSETFDHYGHVLDDPTTLSSDNIMDLHAAADGSLWIATYGGGLNHRASGSDRFTHLTTHDGLPSDAVYSVVPDARGYLWLSTNRGLSRFDPRRRTFRNFEATDGLGGNEFNGRAFFTNPRGEMFFGGIHGLNLFVPENIQDSTYLPPIVLTGFKTLGKEHQLAAPLGSIDEIVLSHKDAFFSFEFAALDYTQPAKNRYAYRLEGFDEDWLQSGNRRWASYTNLDGGRYTFRVKGSNSDGVWNDDGTAIGVVIVPPPWKTWWAFSLYALLLASSVLGYVHAKTRAQADELVRRDQELAKERAVGERLRQIDKIKDEFLANTSHELRTPLNGIIGLAESLLDGAAGPLADGQRSNLFMIAASGRRLAHLVDDILDFAKLKNHEIELQRGPVSLREIVDVVMTILQPLVASKPVELRNELAGDLPEVDGDENRLQQVMHNLIGNAIKFTDRGAITVSAERRDDRLEVTVADTGIGLPVASLEKIFESFEQADASSARHHGGAGLGLTITRQLVELHGGAIRAESAVGEGARFLLTLPLWSGEVRRFTDVVTTERLAQIRALSRQAHVVDSEAAAAGTSEAIAAAPSETPPARILVVDDEDVNLQVLRNFLSLEGYDVAEARSGLEALQSLTDQSQAPDLVLLDVMMPRLTGFEVTRRIRRRYSSSRLPIILVTAKNQVSDLVQGLDAGANDYLTKPFLKNELLARIRTQLHLAQAARAEAENQRKTEELEQARRIQLSMLPDSPPCLPPFEIAVHMRTATEVGGDYYDFFPQDDGSLYAVTGDATGHGISAGMMVTMTKSALKALEVQSPQGLLTELNAVIRAVHLERLMMALNVVHLSDDQIILSSAGMPPVLLFRAASGEVDEVLIPGLPLGGLEQTSYQLRVLPCHPGDVLMMFSDGLPECFANGFGDGYDIVRQRLAENGRRSPERIVAAMVSGDEMSSAEDDVTVVVIKHH